MKCINCGAEMDKRKIHARKQQIESEICDGCGSLWITADELKKMGSDFMENLEIAGAAEDGAEKSKTCPCCNGAPMDRVGYKGNDKAMLDYCENCCGLWFDAGDYGLIADSDDTVMHGLTDNLADFINNVHFPFWRRGKKIKVHTDTEAAPDAGYIPITDAKEKGETEFLCPGCRTPLKRYEAFGIDIEGCEKCGGIWLDRDELRKLKDNATSGMWTTLRWMDDEVDAIEKTTAMPSGRICPKCRTARLISTRFGDSTIFIDWCVKCHGVWLDLNEFHEIVGFLRNKLTRELTSDEMKAKVYEEIREIWSGPEGAVSEALDAKAAISALLNITVFEHPALLKILVAMETLIK